MTINNKKLLKIKKEIVTLITCKKKNNLIKKLA